MRSRPALIGLALLALVAAPSARAQESALCDQLRDAPALSPYVRQVLERADRGMNYIAEGQGGAGGVGVSLYWRTLVENAGSAVISGMDTSRRITSAMQDLTSRSACLRYDAILLSCKIEQVRGRLNERLSLAVSPSVDAAGVFQLQELLIFLFDRDRHLAAGATDPWYADPDWGRAYAFDPPSPGFCCRTGDDGLSCESLDEAECNPGTFWQTEDDCEQACGATSFPAEDPRICPYDSDYAYPTEGGYGCDETVMPDAAIVADEKTALVELRAAVERLRQEAGAEPNAARAPALTGCASEFGHCNDEGAQTCSTNADCEDGAACVFQRGTCLDDPSVSCALDADCGDAEDGELAAVCILPPASPPAAVIRRGPFDLEPDDLRLARSFMDWSVRVGASRPFGSAGAEPRDEGNGSSAYVDPIDFILNQGNRAYFRQAAARFAAGQARLAPLTETSDNLQDMLMPLRKAVAEFSTIAAAKDGVREVVRRFADLLHHSCGTDPCQTDLERVWSMANTDECFAYADGTYLQDDCENGVSRAQICADAAGVTIAVPACDPL